MTRVQLDTRLESLHTLITRIDEGQLALADFQRDFDWSERDARSFLSTMIMGWPAGALLMLRGGSTEVKSRDFAEGPRTVRHPELIVLDGQQRLTAAYHALLDKGPFVHAVRLSALLEDDVELIEDGFRSFPRDRWDAKFRSAPWVEGMLHVPAYALPTRLPSSPSAI
jgi:hypothetical protein